MYICKHGSALFGWPKASPGADLRSLPFYSTNMFSLCRQSSVRETGATSSRKHSGWWVLSGPAGCHGRLLVHLLIHAALQNRFGPWAGACVRPTSGLSWGLVLNMLLKCVCIIRGAPSSPHLVIFHFNTSDWYLGVCQGVLVQWLDIAKKTRGSYVTV